MTPRTDTERAVLGSILLNGEVLGEITSILGPNGDAFIDRQLARLYEAAINAWQEDRPCDVVTLASTSGMTTAQVSGLADSVITSSNATEYAQGVRDAAKARQYDAACRKAIALLREKGEWPDKLEAAEKALYAALENGGTPRGTDTAEALDAALRGLEALSQANGKATGIPSGIPALDRLTGGWQPGDLVVIAARPSVGKTALGLNLAHHAAVKAETPVFFVSLEMGGTQLMGRMVAIHSGASIQAIREGFQAEAELQKAMAAAPALRKAPIVLDDAVQSLWEVRTRARRFRAKHGPGLVVVDYLQLLSADGPVSQRRYEAVTEISRQLKRLAMEIDCPTIALSQLNREADGDKMPRLSHLRESGSIEQDADAVLMLSRLPGSEHDRFRGHFGANADPNSILVADLAKQRNGPVGIVRLYFDRPTQRIREFSGNPTEPPSQAKLEAPHSTDKAQGAYVEALEEEGLF